MNTFDPSGRIVHDVYVDFVKPYIQKPIHIMQYDRSLPILAIHMLNDREPYVFPDNATGKIRWHKPDNTFVYKDALGVSEDGTILYVEVDYQMTIWYGSYNQIIEVFIDENTVAGSSYLPIEIDRNPIQNKDVTSTTEWQQLEEAVNEATQAAQESKDARDVSIDSSLDSEAWAIGTKNGLPVPSTDPQHDNHSKYWAGQSAESADEAEDWADKAEQAANKLGWMHTFIDHRGHLMFIKTPLVPVNLKLIDGHLYSEVTG